MSEYQAIAQNQAPSPHPSGLPPTSKKVVMQLTWIAANHCYRIRAITNTTYYKPDQWLREEDLAIIATKYPNWEFSVDTPDYLGALLGIVGRVAPIAPFL